MTDLHLNLISPDKKKRFVSLVRFIFIKELLEFIILTASLLAITNLLGLLVLSQTLSDVAGSTLLINREQSAVNREVRGINRLNHAIVASGEEFIPLTPYFLELIEAVPHTVVIQGMEFNRAGNGFTLIGVAKTRQALLDFQKILQGISWLKDVSTPTSQLFQKENLSFEFRAMLKGVSATRRPPAERRAPVNPED